MSKYSQALKEWFEARVHVEGDCHIWTGGKYGQGYGKVNFYPESIIGAAHRIAFEIYNAEIPHGLITLHICDNKSCVNPDHLVLGTRNANMFDLRRKHRAAFGSKHPAAKLTSEQAEEIRSTARFFEDATHGQIANRFGVSRSTVTKILSGKAYKV